MATTKPTPQKTVRPFLFDQSFDVIIDPEAEAAAKKKEEEEAPPTFSEEELQAARDDAYKAGLQAGLQEAGASIEQQIAATLDVISGAIGDVGTRQASMNEVIARDAVDVAVAAIRKLLPTTAEANGVAEVTTLVQEVLSRLLQEPRITIRVSERLADQVASHLEAAAAQAGFDGKVLVLPDPDMGPADCRILWNDGEAGRTLDAVLEALDATVSALPRPTADTSEITAHAPPLDRSAPIDVEIDLEAGGSGEDVSPEGTSHDPTNDRDQPAGPA